MEEVHYGGEDPHWALFFKPTFSPPPGYLGHSAYTPGYFSMSYTKTVFQINSYESVYGLALLGCSANEEEMNIF